MNNFEEERFNTGEIEINYVVGPDNGPALVLVPAQGVDWTNYEKVLEPLSSEYQVYSVDIRGHGKSDWTTGNYSFKTIGSDMTAFLEKVVKRKAIISGNSSGGLIALWLAANKPELVKAIILEDPPLFSADWPRIKEDSYVYRVLQVTVEMSKELHESRSISGLARKFMQIKRPVEGGKIRGVPKSAAYFFSFLIRASQKFKSGKPSLPGRLGKVLEVLTNYDADFAQAFVDGRIYEGLDHAEALRSAQCPMLLLHANWLRHPEFGLIGAMDDDDAKRARELAENMEYQRIDSDHVIHSENPEIFMDIVRDFTSRVE
jgi:pimeloyl-ACP methyl ester carboxylesterase